MFESTSSAKSLPSQPASSKHQRRSLGTCRQNTIRYVYWMQYNRPYLAPLRIHFRHVNCFATLYAHGQAQYSRFWTALETERPQNISQCIKPSRTETSAFLAWSSHN